MATIDLDALENALRDEGRMVVSLKRGDDEIQWVSCGGVVVYPSGRLELQPMGVNPADVTAVVYHIGKLWHVSPEPSRRAAVDTEAVLDAVVEFGIYRSDPEYVEPNGVQTRLAAIRAMLEPHGAARLREDEQ